MALAGWHNVLREQEAINAVIHARMDNLYFQINQPIIITYEQQCRRFILRNFPSWRPYLA
jgi:hypothetical protein